MNPYLLFYYVVHESRGGWNDFHSSYDSLENALEAAMRIFQDFPYREECVFQVVHEGKFIHQASSEQIELLIRQDRQKIYWKLLKPILEEMEISPHKIKQVGWLYLNLTKIKSSHPKYAEAMELLSSLVGSGLDVVVE